MAMQGNTTRMPKLRFPEFRARVDWASIPLSEASIPITERVGDRKLTPVSISAGIGFVPQAEKFGRDISGNQYALYTLVCDGDFVYNKGNSLKFPQGCVYQLRGWGEVAAPNVFIAFRLKQGFVAEYFQYCFEKNSHGVQLKKHITSGARSNGLLNVSKEQFFGVRIPTPLEDEQQKIADCLTSLDEVIAVQKRKVEALKTFKLGLLQQLFPKNDDKLPRLRFPEFRDVPEWECLTIQDLIDRQLIVGHMDGNHGELYPRADEFSTTGIPYITANDFRTGRVDFSACRYLPLERAVSFKKGIAKDGDVLFAHNATVGPVAKLTTSYEFVILSTTATYFRCDQIRLLNDFLMFALTSPSFVAQYTRVMSQSTRDQVPITAQRKFVLQLPKLDEQRCIAACLVSLDDEVTAETVKLDSMRKHKQGLMQQLIPGSEEDL